MGNITVWFGNSTKQDRQALQRVVRSAECITHTELPVLQTIYYKRCQTKARRIVKDPTHRNNRLLSLLRSGEALSLPEDQYRETEEEFLPAGHLGTPCREAPVFLGTLLPPTIGESGPGECGADAEAKESCRTTSGYWDWYNDFQSSGVWTLDFSYPVPEVSHSLNICYRQPEVSHSLSICYRQPEVSHSLNICYRQPELSRSFSICYRQPELSRSFSICYRQPELSRSFSICYRQPELSRSFSICYRQPELSRSFSICYRQPELSRSLSI
ncbi:hypothetical protein P4O66_016227 [Electrophorus voltai]|uniref:Uncharacterized protein n=1 Tax=Electrophorus voltai TaxID=2609070 RepID=A0AAD9DM68_9TELE|nr:hypothetical protein P4O66_016227 [Electrophorus voltai]